MENKLSTIGVLFIAFVCSIHADPIIKCPSGFNLNNEDKNKVVMDQREWKTCTEPGKTTCAVMSYSYRYPCDGCEGDLVSGGTYIPCVNEAEAVQWISKYTTESHTSSALPYGAKYVSSGYEFCNESPCFDFTPAVKSGLTCNWYSVAKDDASGEVIAKAQLPATQDCYTHQPSCYEVEVDFVDQDTGKPATMFAGGCYNDYAFWFDRYYPHASKNEKFCEEHGCSGYWGGYGCFCYGDNKVEGRGGYVESNCTEDLCN